MMVQNKRKPRRNDHSATLLRKPMSKATMKTKITGMVSSKPKPNSVSFICFRMSLSFFIYSQFVKVELMIELG